MLPDVRSASLASSVPMGYIGNSDTILLPGTQASQTKPDLNAGYNVVTPGYFETMGIKVSDGRTFTAADEAGAHLQLSSAGPWLESSGQSKIRSDGNFKWPATPSILCESSA